jgi:hypothetical protein
MGKCTAITQSGNRCKGIAIDGSDYCYAHHPDHAANRHRNASKGGKRGGRGRPLTDVANAKQRLSDLADDVLNGVVDRSVAGTASQILNVYLRAVDLELKAREQQELEARLEEIEAALEGQSPADGGWQGGYHRPG